MDDLKVIVGFTILPNGMMGGELNEEGCVRTEIEVAIPRFRSGDLDVAFKATALVFDRKRRGAQAEQKVEILRLRSGDALFAPLPAEVWKTLPRKLETMGRNGIRLGAIADRLTDSLVRAGWDDLAAKPARASDVKNAAPHIRQRTEQVEQAMRDEAASRFIEVNGKIFERRGPPALNVRHTYHHLPPNYEAKPSSIGHAILSLDDGDTTSPDFGFSLDHWAAANDFLEGCAAVGRDGRPCVIRDLRDLRILKMDGADLAIDEPGRNVAVGTRMVLNAVKEMTGSFPSDALKSYAVIARLRDRALAGDGNAPARLITELQAMQAQKFFTTNSSDQRQTHLNRAMKFTIAAVGASRSLDREYVALGMAP